MAELVPTEPHLRLVPARGKTLAQRQAELRAEAESDLTDFLQGLTPAAELAVEMGGLPDLLSEGICERLKRFAKEIDAVQKDVAALIARKNGVVAGPIS